MEKIYTLLCESFSPSEFDRLLVFEDGFGAGATLRDELPPAGTSPAATYFFEVLLVLRRRGALGGRFVAALRRARPLRAADIAGLAAEVRGPGEGGSCVAPASGAWRPARTLGRVVSTILAAALSSSVPDQVDAGRVEGARLTLNTVDVGSDGPAIRWIPEAPSMTATRIPTESSARASALPSSSRRSRKVEKGARPTRAIPAPAATITASVVEAHVGGAILELGKDRLRDLSFTVAVLPGGQINASSLETSGVYGALNAGVRRRIAGTQLPPSLLGSGSVVCYVFREVVAPSGEPSREVPRLRCEHLGRR